MRELCPFDVVRSEMDVRRGHLGSVRSLSELPRLNLLVSVERMATQYHLHFISIAHVSLSA